LGIFPATKNFYKKFQFRDFEIIYDCSGIRDVAPTDLKEGWTYGGREGWIPMLHAGV